MNNEEFRAAVMRGLKTVENKNGGLETDFRVNVEHSDERLNVVVARLDEQDAAHDRLLDKVDRLAVPFTRASKPESRRSPR